MARYFIEVDTYWQNSPSYFVGPFATRAEAEAWHQQDVPDDANVWYSDSTCGGNIRDAWRIYRRALSATEAKGRGMREGGERPNTLPVMTSPTANDLSDAVCYLHEVYA